MTDLTSHRVFFLVMLFASGARALTYLATPLSATCVAWKYLIAVFLGVVIYSEWFVYVVQPLFWNTIECEVKQNCIKILFVADPQIQGDEAVAPPFRHLVNWDSDRYLRSTYSVVEKHFKPDVVVFLGDLMDEGSISTTTQFNSYVQRLANIFDPYYPVVQIWIPGDNDIGGENEPIKQDKMTEFNRVYSQPSVIAYQNVSFYKVSSIRYAIPEPLDEDLNYKIAISHYPVLRNSFYAKQVINSIHPDVFFCAHEHKSKYVKQGRDFRNMQTYLLQYNDTVLTIPLKDSEEMYEIYVPTCSYRMGTNQIGFGAAIVDKNQQHLKYTVFWSTGRFPYLKIYLFFLIIILIYTLLCCSLRVLAKFSHVVVKTEDMKHLLERP
ncbi:uncharacterized protein LOC123706355 isoform X1 [Colias croceus]|uniref:uncharacterized protein LOC123706355 isoform X1 n=1 Tax=Colias crocea TaxID=72248 RepID=UPI001E279DA1|nr:uncharacterized protein LOC123706355 isoform X1 [Colias croceus]